MKIMDCVSASFLCIVRIVSAIIRQDFSQGIVIRLIDDTDGKDHAPRHHALVMVNSAVRPTKDRA